MTDVFGEAVKYYLEKGDMESIQKLCDGYGQMEYNLLHDVRMSGAHMAPACQGKECEPYKSGSKTEKP